MNPSAPRTATCKHLQGRFPGTTVQSSSREAHGVRWQSVGRWDLNMMACAGITTSWFRRDRYSARAPETSLFPFPCSINAGSKRSACSTSVCAKAMPCQKSKRISAEAAAWRLALQDLLQVFSDFTRLRNIGAAFIVRSSPDGDTLNLQAPPSVKYVDRFSFADLCQHHPHVKCPSSSGRQPPPGIRACWMQFDRVLAGI